MGLGGVRVRVRVDPDELAHGHGAAQVLSEQLLLQRAREELDDECDEHGVGRRHPKVDPHLIRIGARIGARARARVRARGRVRVRLRVRLRVRVRVRARARARARPGLGLGLGLATSLASRYSSVAHSRSAVEVSSRPAPR